MAVDQFTLGLEKRLFSCSSLELRIPFLNHFDSGAPSDSFDKSSLEIGNISLVFKYLFARTDNWTLAGGIGMMFPTAENWTIPEWNASLKNKAYNLVPYFGVQWHPDHKTFGHFLLQVDIPVSDNELHLADMVDDVGEQTALRIGLQAGRWFYRNERGAHTCRLGGFLEIDYTTTLDNASGDGIHWSVYNLYLPSRKRRAQPLNMVVGVPILFGQLSITNAVIVPLTSNDRQFPVAYNVSVSRRF